MFEKLTEKDLSELAASWGFTFAESELAPFRALADEVVDTISGLDAMPDSLDAEPISAVRDEGPRPTPADDPYNAVVRWCSAHCENVEGPLSGVRVGLKDSIAVAGIPLSGGTKFMQGFVPSVDSTIATRILRAGGEIVAMLNMDYMAFSAGGDSSAYGPTLCPFDLSRTAGGSSGGAGAALHYQGIDVTVGCDQGGSIRVPAAWSGVVGLKPTHGLVPYTGILGIDQLIDHVGPLARTAADAARLLDVMAGPDDSDPRQQEPAPMCEYGSVVARAPDSLSGVRLGLLREALSPDLGVDEITLAAFETAVDELRALGAEVVEIVIPEHLCAGPIAYALYMEGMATLVAGGGNGYQWRGRYWPELAMWFAQHFAEAGADDLSDQMKLVLTCGRHMQRRYYGAAYALAMNRQRWLADAYDRAFAGVDHLVMPTCPTLPHAVDPSLDVVSRVLRGWSVLANTGQFNITGHPAISLPLGEAEGLPVGIMLVARRNDDDRLLSLAATVEGAVGWKPNRPVVAA